MDIFEAARLGDCSLIQHYITQLNSANEDGDTALLLATKSCHRNAVELLIKAGASVDVVNKERVHSTFTALRNNDIVILKLLLDNGADPNIRCCFVDKSTLLVEAAFRGRDAMIKLLLASGANADSINQFGDSALTLASLMGSLDSAKALLDAGANPSRFSKNGKSVFAVAKDDSMRQLLITYQNGGPSWLARELSAQGLSWSVVCDVEAKLVKEGFVSHSVMANTSLASFTDDSLKSVGIPGLAVRAMVRDVRLRATWLGARLAVHNVHAFSLATCEDIIVMKYNCTTPELFAALLPEDLSLEVLHEHDLYPNNMETILLEVQREVSSDLAIAKVAYLNRDIAPKLQRRESTKDTADAKAVHDTTIDSSATSAGSDAGRCAGYAEVWRKQLEQEMNAIYMAVTTATAAGISTPTASALIPTTESDTTSTSTTTTAITTTNNNITHNAPLQTDTVECSEECVDSDHSVGSWEHL